MDLKFPYFRRSRFLCSQQRGPGHLGSMPQDKKKRNGKGVCSQISSLRALKENVKWLR